MSNKKTFDFSSETSEDCDSAEDKFNLFVKKILNDYKLVVGDQNYSIEEIELYYHSPDHEDTYTHKSKDQLKNSKWYFHKYGNGTYKSGTYKGLDMTFGNGDDSYGGALIRSISNDKTDEFITGPCNAVNHILNKYDFSESSELVDDMEDLDLFNEDNKIYLSSEFADDADNTIFTKPTPCGTC
jgi:hypothetical protein